MTPAEQAEFHSLLDALCQETVTPEQMGRLEQLVSTDGAAAAEYVQCVQMFAELGRHFESGAGKIGAEVDMQPRDATTVGPGLLPPQATRPPILRRRVLWTSLGLVALAGGVLLAVVMLRPAPLEVPQRPQREEASDDTVALLVRAPGAEWEQTELPTRVGSALRAGLLKLKSGGAQLEFYSGATVILEGPAEFRLVSRTEGYCARGKLWALVPEQSHGFRIGSPGLKLVDRGTEFGLVVGDRTEVHVFQGKVELYDPRAEGILKELTTGQSVRLEKAGQVSLIEPNPGGFLRAEELAARYQEEMKRRRQGWQVACDALRKDPSLEVFFRFGEGEIAERRVTDLSGKTQRDGKIVGCSWIAGRWPGSKALEFKHVSDRVLLQVPGEFKSLTLMAWVRVDALPNTNNSLMMSDGWEEGGLHWQIGGSSKLILGVQSSPKGNGAHYHALGAVPPKMFGQRLHLAVVYDQAAGTVTHYVNGKQASQTPILFDIPLRIGNAELGNWNIASHQNMSPVRFFTGSMDEFMAFSRPFKADEIERLHVEGQPPF